MHGERHLTDAERRARLVARHHLGGTADDVVAAVRGVLAMHASDPLTPYLGVRARLATPATALGDLDHALYEERSLWRLHAVRRTLFVAGLDDAVLLEAAASRDVARGERQRLLGWLAAEVGGDEPAARFVDRVGDAVVERLRSDGPRTTRELVALLPDLATEVTLGSGRWAQRSSVGPRLLLLLAMEARVVRGRPLGTWRGSQFTWAATERWFPRPPPLLADEDDARRRLLVRYLETHGPVTRTDLVWWTGWTVRRTEAALRGTGAVEVSLDGGGRGFVLARDVEAVTDEPSQVALLPGLDPTVMGWKERDWYLGPHAGALFDRNGNAGPTTWLDGRVVGGWAVRDDGEVVHRLLEDVGTEGRRRVEEAVADLTAWLVEQGVVPRFRTPLERELTA